MARARVRAWKEIKMTSFQTGSHSRVCVEHLPQNAEAANHHSRGLDFCGGNKTNHWHVE